MDSRRERHEKPKPWCAKCTWLSRAMGCLADGEISPKPLELPDFHSLRPRHLCLLHKQQPGFSSGPCTASEEAPRHGKATTVTFGPPQVTTSSWNPALDAGWSACDSWLCQILLVGHLSAWIKSPNAREVVFGCSYVRCTTFSSLCLKCLPSLLWARVFAAHLCMFLFKEKVQQGLWPKRFVGTTMIPHFGCESVDL